MSQKSNNTGVQVLDPIDALAEAIAMRLNRQPHPGAPALPTASKAQLYKVREVASLLSVCTRTVETLIAKGVFRPVRIGRALRIPASQVDAYVALGAK